MICAGCTHVIVRTFTNPAEELFYYCDIDCFKVLNPLVSCSRYQKTVENEVKNDQPILSKFKRR